MKKYWKIICWVVIVLVVFCLCLYAYPYIPNNEENTGNVYKNVSYILSPNTDLTLEKINEKDKNDSKRYKYKLNFEQYTAKFSSGYNPNKEPVSVHYGMFISSGTAYHISSSIKKHSLYYGEHIGKGTNSMTPEIFHDRINRHPNEDYFEIFFGYKDGADPNEFSAKLEKYLNQTTDTGISFIALKTSDKAEDYAIGVAANSNLRTSSLISDYSEKDAIKNSLVKSLEYLTEHRWTSSVVMRANIFGDDRGIKKINFKNRLRYVQENGTKVIGFYGMFHKDEINEIMALDSNIFVTSLD